MLRVPALATAVIAALLLTYWVLAWTGAARKLAPLEPVAEGRAHYRIALDFAPERFHQLVLQDLGRLVEVRGNTVYMMDVTPAALHDIAERYWVASIERWSGR